MFSGFLNGAIAEKVYDKLSSGFVLTNWGQNDGWEMQKPIFCRSLRDKPVFVSTGVVFTLVDLGLIRVTRLKDGSQRAYLV